MSYVCLQDKKGKQVAKGDKQEAALQVLLKILGGEKDKPAMYVIMPILNLLEAVLVSLKVKTDQKADSSSRPGKRPRPGSLETLEEGNENAAEQSSPQQASSNEQKTPAPKSGTQS